MTKNKDTIFEEPVEIEIEQPGAQEQSDDRVEAADATGGTAADEALARAEADLARHKEAMLRMQAETENVRKRLQRDLERSRKFALEGVMKDLLQVRDSLERGLEIDPGSATVESLIEGQELTLRMLNKVMEEHHLEAIDPTNEPFDPELHEAMTVLPSADHDENTVLEVIQKGFRLHDRLIRPAMVVVSRKP